MYLNLKKFHAGEMLKLVQHDIFD